MTVYQRFRPPLAAPSNPHSEAMTPEQEDQIRAVLENAGLDLIIIKGHPRTSLLGRLWGSAAAGTRPGAVG